MKYTEASAKQVRKLLVDVMQRVTALPNGRVLIETKADRRPSEGLYCTLWFKELTPLVQNDGDFEYNTDEPTTELITQTLDHESLCTVQLTMWGDDAYDRVTDAMQALQNAQRQFDLWQILGFAGFDSVQDISVQYGAKIQQRAFVNLHYYACLGKKYPSDWFDVSQWEMNLPAKNYKEEFILPKGGYK